MGFLSNYNLRCARPFSVVRAMVLYSTIDRSDRTTL